MFKKDLFLCVNHVKLKYVSSKDKLITLTIIFSTLSLTKIRWMEMVKEKMIKIAKKREKITSLYIHYKIAQIKVI